MGIFGRKKSEHEKYIEWYYQTYGEYPQGPDTSGQPYQNTAPNSYQQVQPQQPQYDQMQRQYASMNYAPQPMPSKPRKKSGVSAGAVLLIILIVLAVIFILPNIISGYNNAKEKREVQSRAQAYTEGDYKAMCKAVSYDEISRHSNAMKGSFVTFSGTVMQELEDGLYRVSTKDYSDDIVIRYSGTRLLTGDKVTVWGESSGFIEGKTVLGAKAKVPEITVVYADIIKQPQT